MQLIGGKTGYNDFARYCLVVATKIDGRTYYMAFLGDEGKLTRFGDVARVADWIVSHKPKTVVAAASAPAGDATAAAPAAPGGRRAPPQPPRSCSRRMRPPMADPKPRRRSAAPGGSRAPRRARQASSPRQRSPVGVRRCARAGAARRPIARPRTALTLGVGSACYRGRRSRVQDSRPC